MRQFMMVFFAALTVFALNATMVASVNAAPEALNAEGKPTAGTFSGNSEIELKFAVLKSSLEVKCGKVKLEGTLDAGGKLGTFKLSCEKATTSLGGQCTGLGDVAGTLLFNGTLHLAANLGLTAGLLLFLVEHAHFSCTVLGITKLFLMLGEVLAEVTPINTLTATLTVNFKRGAEPGDPGVTEYENDNGQIATLSNAIKMSENDATTEEMASWLGGLTVTVTPAWTLDV